MNKKEYINVDGIDIPIVDERNLLEVIRKANIEIPTFCYHSELSIYGACRLCMVDIEGRGILASCSTPPEAGMVVKTNTDEIRELRKVSVELLLANHDNNCTTCNKSITCKLQTLAKRFGVKEIRFKQLNKQTPLDESSPSLVRDPNKCILCGDCVRMCSEVQGIGAIDFAHRGHDVEVLPAFGKDLNDVECVFCGQCARVCPTGALIPKSDIDLVWNEIFNKEKTVVFQIAPAVRVALGEVFGIDAGTSVTGQIVAALKKMGADYVYDTSFTADLTILEEGTEFINRVINNGILPQFTSCCPGWVKTAEQYYPELLDNLSSCKSPQQMFGSLAKDVLPKKLNVKADKLTIVSVMPCTAKKFEASRPEFKSEDLKDVDYVLTTQELAQMIDEQGIDFKQLKPESLDLPFGFKTGAGVIFANSGGVSEAVLRYAHEVLDKDATDPVDFKEVRGDQGIREAVVTLGGIELKLAVVSGLANAKKVAEDVKNGKSDYHIIEVMACPGGCVGGAGQPVSFDPDVKQKRTQGIYACDKMLQLHKSQENPYIKDVYENCLGEIGGHKSHDLLHTEYQHRRRLDAKGFSLHRGNDINKLEIAVCVGTNCYLKGSQDLLHQLLHYIEEKGLTDKVDVHATFCLEECGKGPNVMVGDDIVNKCDFDKVRISIDNALSLRV